MLKEKLKAMMVRQDEKDSKKKIENIVVFVLVLIVTIIAINTIWNGNKTTTNEQDNLTADKQLADQTLQEEVTEEEDIQTDLETILSKINGVGKVKVLISYVESSEVVAMYNESSKNSQIEEKDSSGGTRVTTQEDVQKDIVYKEEDGDKVPITQKVVSPKIEGAIITAEGARKCKRKK
jgi:stage III sporulation protein AG